MGFTVGDLAKLTGITVRSLHHYDEIGLVRPSDRSAAGYRLYSTADVERLQQVLVLRELGLALHEIGAVLEGADRMALLRRHRAELVAKRGRLDALVAAIDAALANEGKAMQPDNLKKMFAGFDHQRYEQEAEQRWGDTPEYKESARRTKSYGPAEWEQIKSQGSAIYAALANLMAAGRPVTDPHVQELVERHRLHIDRWFYPCSKEMHRSLGHLYIADPRFTANLDKSGPGFAQYLSDAIAAS